MSSEYTKHRIIGRATHRLINLPPFKYIPVSDIFSMPISCEANDAIDEFNPNNIA
jgi:hypothetical protein